jgi:hypothetical protein
MSTSSKLWLIGILGEEILACDQPGVTVTLPKPPKVTFVRLIE